MTTSDAEFKLNENFETSHIIYISKSNKTLWKRVNGTWSCALCRDKLDLCRGCGGMSSMYPECFGSCGNPFLLCPNCVCLKGPENCYYFDSYKDLRYVEFDSDQDYGWKENKSIEGQCGTIAYDDTSDEFTGSIKLSFVTFQPNKIVGLKFIKIINI